MGVYEENIVPIKIAQLAEYVSKVKRISLDDYSTFHRQEKEMKLYHGSTVAVRKPSCS